MLKSDYLTITFNPEDLANSEIWWIKGYWNTIKKLWKELKGTELEQVNKNNIREFLELNMKTILFSNGRFNKFFD